MEHIWAPWRIKYIENAKSEKCFLCENPKSKEDDKNYIVYRGKLNCVMLNSFPYNPGHLLVAPYRHIATLEEMTTEERHEHIDLVTRAGVVLRNVLKPAGLNYGVNAGRVAGAGVADHVHSHIVPRWSGDTNFVTVIGDIRVVPEALADSYLKIKAGFAAI